MAKSNKERKELKEKAIKEEEKRKKRKFFIAKLVLTGVNVLTLPIAIVRLFNNDYLIGPIGLFIIFALPGFFMMMFGTKKHHAFGTRFYSFSELGASLLLLSTFVNIVFIFI